MKLLDDHAMYPRLVELGEAQHTSCTANMHGVSCVVRILQGNCSVILSIHMEPTIYSEVMLR